MDDRTRKLLAGVAIVAGIGVFGVGFAGAQTDTTTPPKEPSATSQPGTSGFDDPAQGGSGHVGCHSAGQGGTSTNPAAGLT